jgi:hypothetical protein
VLAARTVAEAAATADKSAHTARRVAAEAVSRATIDTKLAEARALESHIAAKAAQIQAVEERIARGDGSAEKNKVSGEKEKRKEIEVDMHAHDMKIVELLEREMEMLGKKVETLRIEADEEFARCLANREDESEGWK